MTERVPDYDITSATSEAAQGGINWAGICALDHDSVDLDGIGVFAVDSGEAGVQGSRPCQNCEYIRSDFRDWLRQREGAA